MIQIHRNVKALIMTTLAVASVALAVIWPNWHEALQAQNYQPSFIFNNCREAQSISQTPERATGDVARGFIGCFNDLLTAMDVLAVEANKDRMEFVRPLLDLYRQKVPEIITLLQQVLIERASRREIEDFEERVISSQILDEAVAFETFLNAPTELISTVEKQDKSKIVKDSIKDFINKVLEAVQKKFIPEIPIPGVKPKPIPIPAVVKSVFEVLEEIYNTLVR